MGRHSAAGHLSLADHASAITRYIHLTPCSRQPQIPTAVVRLQPQPLHHIHRRLCLRALLQTLQATTCLAILPSNPYRLFLLANLMLHAMSAAVKSTPCINRPC